MGVTKCCFFVLLLLFFEEQTTFVSDILLLMGQKAEVWEEVVCAEVLVNWFHRMPPWPAALALFLIVLHLVRLWAQLMSRAGEQIMYSVRRVK